MTDDRRAWEALRDTATSVVFLSQRPGGMWSLPTSDFELLQPGAAPGSKELPIRKREKFGYPSITVSWIALRGLRASLGRIPDQARQVLTELTEFKSPRAAYGSPASRHRGSPSINESPRHTATALLLLMEFGTAAYPPPDLLPSIRWLLSKRTPGTGWRFEDNAERMGPITTATSLAALTRFAALTSAEDFGPELPKALVAAVDEGLNALISSANNGVWDCSGEGRFQSTEISDSAFVIWVLGQATSESAPLLQSCRSSDIRRLRRDLLSRCVGDGWPRSIADRTVSAPATVWVLRMVAEAAEDDPMTDYQDLITRANLHLINEMSQDDSWRSFEMWDWAALAELASSHTGAMSERTQNRL